MAKFWVLPLFGASLMIGCTTSVVLPLCSDVASNSFDGEEVVGNINSYVIEAAQDRDIEITELSPFVAEFRGSAQEISWLQERYPHLVCAFDPKQELLDREVYITCLSEAPGWIGVVQSERPQDLMTTQTLYRETCASQR